LQLTIMTASVKDIIDNAAAQKRAILKKWLE
jgi:hypothetical protein